MSESLSPATEAAIANVAPLIQTTPSSGPVQFGTVPDLSPAETLRTAAEILRHTAQRATHEQGPRWMLGTTDTDKAAVVLDHPDQPTVLIQSYAERLEAVNAYLVRMHPGVGLALANWLDSAAEDAKQIGPDFRALVVARQILGGAS